MSHEHDKLAGKEEPKLYKVTDLDGKNSVRQLYIADVYSLIELGYTVKEMKE